MTGPRSAPSPCFLVCITKLWGTPTLRGPHVPNLKTWATQHKAGSVLVSQEERPHFQEGSAECSKGCFPFCRDTLSFELHPRGGGSFLDVLGSQKENYNLVLPKFSNCIWLLQVTNSSESVPPSRGRHSLEPHPGLRGQQIPLALWNRVETSGHIRFKPARRKGKEKEMTRHWTSPDYLRLRSQ